MDEPWNIKIDDSRPIDNIKTFIIFCEDGEVEPEYFSTFSNNNTQVSLIRNKGKHHQQVDYATQYCRANDLLELVDQRERLKLDSGAQVWCVYDRDKEEDDGKESTFNNSIDSAESKGMRVAWSNDDFELWVLLHFEDVDVNNKEYYHRSKYYDRLTDILKSLSDKTEDEIRIIDNPKFHYYHSMKSKKRFLGITYQRMKGRMQEAIKRSQYLEDYHNNKGGAHHIKVPCTMVHKLVLELLK